jgi:UDP-N-acetylmuramoyl-L-alanyl-D-glutamate--2,6-diaminopimelate ligase
MNARKLVKLVVPRGLFRRIEPVGHLLEAVFWQVVYGFPARGLKVVGVTGTNGKTTTCFLVHKMLAHAGYNVGLMSTVAYGVGDELQPQVAHMTSVPTREMLQRIKQMKASGAEWIVLETTSHALAQHRVWGIPYSIAVLTNLTHEHLDYHRTFENYRNAKRKMFQMADKNHRGHRLGIINADDPNFGYFEGDIAHPLSYGIDKGDVKARQVKLSPDGVDYRASFEGLHYHIKCQIPGSFNVYNSLAAMLAGQAAGLSKQQIEQGIAALSGVEGRMTNIDEGQNFSVIVDFAHTPDSFEKLFKDLKPVVQGKLIVMFGSAGRRDEAKRAIQGELAGKYADEVVITEEDDRDVDGQKIMKQIASGAEKAGKKRDKNLFLVHDRAEAIQFAIKRAKKNDTVLLLGKGHEKTIERADGEHPWDELGTAREALQKTAKK